MTSARRFSTDRRAAGFTLVEVLVTLMITSLLFGVLIGALIYGFRAQDALSTEVARQQGSLRAQWSFQHVIAGALPAPRDSIRKFEGSEQAMTFETMAAQAPGSLTVPVRVAVNLVTLPDGRRALEIGTGGSSERIAEWPADEAAFAYVDSMGDELKRWPPERTEGGVMPRAVRLTVKRAGAPLLVWSAAPRADPWVEPRIPNPFGLELP